MTRFELTRRKSSVGNMILSVLIFAAILIVFYMGISSLSKTSGREQAAALRSAMTQSAVHCYALNGYYPESLEALIKDYGITYDEDLFLVDYQPQGRNLMPEITVIEKGR